MQEESSKPIEVRYDSSVCFDGSINIFETLGWFHFLSHRPAYYLEKQVVELFETLTKDESAYIHDSIHVNEETETGVKKTLMKLDVRILD